MAFEINLQQTWSSEELTPEYSDSADLIYEFVKWWRIGVIALSSGLLIVNIVMICRSKQYIYNTLKLFLFLEFFTVLGQVIVIFHPLMKPNQHQDYFSTPQNINQIIQDILSENSADMVACSIEAYVNLFCYNFSYLFALLITLYVRKVIDNTHKYFMRKHTKLIIYVAIGTFLVYLPPFVMSFFPGVPYSFGPIGFQLQDNVFSGSFRNYMFYCGITARADDFWAQFLSALNMMMIPVLMFVIHIVLIVKNSRSMKFLKALEQLNPRQWFILKSGTLSTFVFAIQFINFMKYLLSLFSGQVTALVFILGVANMFFDFFPIVLVLFYYKKYYQKGKKLQEKSLVRTDHSQSVDTQEIINF